MPKNGDRDKAPADGRPVERRLTRIPETPLLVAIPDLAPETLHQLIRHRGLDACGELVASTTPAQLTAVLDIDLWRHQQPGRDHVFDVDRFGEWIEVLVDVGEAIAARTVAALDAELVVAGLSRCVRVFDPGIFEPVAQSDDERSDRHEAMREGDAIPGNASGDDFSGRLECEIGGYVVRARRADAWDAIVTLLLALESEDADCFHAVMRGCRRTSNSTPEIDGLDDLLSVPEQQLHDLAIEREHRRAQHGYATPADARAFLETARPPKHNPPAAPMPARPVVASFALERAASDVWPARFVRLRQLMNQARDTDEAIDQTRTSELAFLTNTLIAGCSIQSSAFTTEQASEAAASVCNLGLEYWPDDPPRLEQDLVTAFEVGWSVLHRDVSMFVAQRLISILDDLQSLDRDLQRDLTECRRQLVEHCDAGRPWLARGAVDVLAMLDVTAWHSVLGLLDECPIVPATLTAVLEGQSTSVSATGFEFISTAAQIGDVRVFMRMLPDLLSR